ncbi:GrpB family protein [Bacillaceae bacterium W0354]
MLGLKKNEVKLLPFNSNWKKSFVEEKKLLELLIGEHITGIEHFGSTAIPGIKAKPIIDILIGVRSLEDVEKFDAKKLGEADYYHLPRVQIEGKVLFAKFSDLKNLTRTHYVHIVEHGGDWWKEHLNFRDQLIANPSLAKEYETLKVKYATEYPDDVQAYTDAKEEFVESVLKR